MRKYGLATLCCSSILLVSAVGLPQAGGVPPFEIQRSTVAGGGSSGAGSVFSLTSSVGEAVSGMTGSGSGFGVGPGFWTVTSTGYSINGQVLQSNGRGITGATVTLTGGPLQLPRNLKTTKTGAFRFDDLSPGFTYTVTVTARRFTFSPNNQTVLLDNTAEGLIFSAMPTSVIDDIQ